MILTIRLVSFRTYDTVRLNLDPEFNCIVGPNGVGKTSLLEALAYMGFGNSPWSNRSADVININCSEAVIQGKGPERKQEVRIILKRGGRKEVIVAEKRLKKLSSLLGIFRMTAIGPQEIELVRGSPSTRRKFLDSVLCQIDSEYTESLGKYKTLVNDRNAALKGVRNGEMAGGHILIETWDDTLAPQGAIIMSKRDRLIKKISRKAAGIYNEITEKTGGTLELKYKPTINIDGLGEGDITDSYKKHLSARRKREIDTGETALGPHRDELLFYKDGENMDRFGSWGQERAASIATILAASELLYSEDNGKVVLLLDDCFAELDPDNTRRLLEMLPRFGQVFLTSPRPLKLPDKIRPAVFKFKGIGEIYRVKE